MTKKEEKTSDKEVKKEKKVKEPVVELDKIKLYPIEEAISLAKTLKKTKFDASIEVHFNLNIDPKKGDQQLRTALSLPHGTGKTVKIAAFVSPDKEAAVKKAGADLVGSEDLINEIKKTEKTDFEVAIAEPVIMKDLAKIAKILGTRGLMPSPKNETITMDPVKAVEELKKGKISFKNDDTGNVHAVFGKVSFDDKKLIENFTVILDLIRKIKPATVKGTYIKNVSISSSMGPGIKVEI